MICKSNEKCVPWGTEFRRNLIVGVNGDSWLGKYNRPACCGYPDPQGRTYLLSAVSQTRSMWRPRALFIDALCDAIYDNDSETGGSRHEIKAWMRANVTLRPGWSSRLNKAIRESVMRGVTVPVKGRFKLDAKYSDFEATTGRYRSIQILALLFLSRVLKSQIF